MTAFSQSPRRGRPEELLKRAWLGQLRWEYRQLLARPALKRLKPAALSLSAAGHFLGWWHPGRRLIAISEKLIENSSWTVVQGVLAHETAHQIVDELYRPAASDKPHGELFLAACDLLGLFGPYRRSKLDLAELKAAETGAEGRFGAGSAEGKALNLVKKLLALASSPVQAEAEAAMLKAARIMARHNLEVSGEPGRPAYQVKIINTGRRRLSSLQAGLAGLLAEFYFVEVVLSTVYNPRLDVKERGIEIFGRPENVALAEHIYHFILASLDSLWPAARKAGLKSRFSFSLGLLEGFRAKLKNHNQRLRALAPDLAGPPEATLSALVLAADAGLSGFIKKRHPWLRLAGYRGSASDSSSRQAGFKAGWGLVAHRPLTRAGAGSVAGLLA